MFGQSSAPMTSAEGVLVTIDDESDTLHGPYPGTPAGGVGWEAGASALDDLALAHHPGQTVQSSKGVLQLELHPWYFVQAHRSHLLQSFGLASM